MAKYILYCAQVANFQTRSMLVPYDKYLQCSDLVNDFDVLRSASKSCTFKIADKDYYVDNLIVCNLVTDGNLRFRDGKTNYSEIVHNLTDYAHGMDEDCYCRMSDQDWYSEAITNLCGNFNHVKNYCMLRSLTSYENKPIEIVEGFLVLESINGKLKYPTYDTVSEMFSDLFSQK